MSADDLPYQPFYCEENIYRLCESGRLEAATKKVVFASNARRQIALWHQKPTPAPEDASVWDYHVFLLARPPGREGWDVWDPSSTLGAPARADVYLDLTFESGAVPARLRPVFRVIPGPEFLATFASDRSHMRQGGKLREPPPPWPPIGAPGAPSNLARFIQMRPGFVGDVMDLDGLRATLSATARIPRQD